MAKKGKPKHHTEPTEDDVRLMLHTAPAEPAKPSQPLKIGIVVEPVGREFHVVEVTLNGSNRTRTFLKSFRTEQEADRYATVEAERVRLMNPNEKPKAKTDYRLCWGTGPRLMEVDDD